MTKDQGQNPGQFCAVCARPLEAGRFYVVRVDVFADPAAQPTIVLNFLDDEREMDILVDGVRTAWQLAHHPDIMKLGQGFVVLGFPCDQFGHQEPGSEDEIREFCSLNYDVSFPMFSKVEVNGEGTHPLYRYLKKEARGVLGTEAIKWNFTKFLVGRDGQVIKRYAPKDAPESLVGDIEVALA